MAERQSATDLVPFNNQERYVEQCAGVLEFAPQLLEMYKHLDSYAKMCAGTVVQYEKDSIPFEQLQEMKKVALEKITAAITTLDTLDTKIAAASGIRIHGFDKAKNGAVSEMRKMLNAALESIKGADVTKFPPMHFKGRSCLECAKEFYDVNKKNGTYSFDAYICSQVVEEGNSTRSSRIENASLPGAKKVITEQGPDVLAAAMAVDKLFSCLESFRDTASKKRQAQFQEKVPELLQIINEALQRDTLTPETHRGGNLVGSVYQLIDFISTQLARRGGEEFWTSDDFKIQIQSIMNRVRKDHTSYDQGSVVQEARQLRQAQRPETGVDNQQRVAGETVQGGTEKSRRLLRVLLNFLLRR